MPRWRALPSCAPRLIPIKLATLTPLTGAGGPYGPVMAKAAASVVEEVNKAGGVLGRRIVLVSEDDQTNPEAAVRAARKLIDVDKVSAIMGTWASSVTTAVAPLCWESKTFLCTVSGADSITLLPHQGFLIRTQPNSKLQVTRVGEFILSLGAKKAFTMIPQTPFTQSTFDVLNQVLPKGGCTHQSLIYDDKKTTYRTEVDQALRTSPDVILANGYTPDTVVLLKDLYRAGFKGKILGFAYSINQKLVDQVGQPEVVEGVYTFAPSPAEGSSAFEKVEGRVGLGQSRSLHLPGLRPRQPGADGDRQRQGSDRRGDQGEHPQGDGFAAASRSTTPSTASRRSWPAARSTMPAPRARATSTRRATSSTASSATTRSRPASSRW